MSSLKVAADHAFVMPEGVSDATSSTSLTMAQALPNYLLDDPLTSKEYQLVDFRSALAGLALPGYGKLNQDHIWPVDLDDYLPDVIKTEAQRDKSEAEAINTVKGKSKIGFDLVVLAAADEKQNPVYLYVIDDKVRKRMMVVGPQEIATPLESELRVNGVEYVVKGDAGSVSQINEFLAEGAKRRGEIGKLIQGNTQGVIEGLIKAFSALCELTDSGPGASPDEMTVNKGATVGQVIYNSKSTPSVFTSIVKAKGP